MSLINRMLDELAARQAPGTESLQGVRLNEPLERARDGLDRAKLVLLALLVAAIPGLCWWLWPSQVQAPVPRARLAPVEAVTEVPPARAPSPLADAPSETAVPDVPTPRLQLASHLESLDHADEASREAPAPAPVDRVARIEPPPEPPEPKRAPAPKPAPVEPAPIALAPDASIDGPTATPPAPPPPAVDPPIERRQRARQALADQDPAGALQILGAPAAADDVESAALRAQALQRLGRHAQAADEYARLTTRDPAEASHWVGLAISLESERRHEPARLAYRRALQSDRLAPPLRAFAQERLTVLESP